MDDADVVDKLLDQVNENIDTFTGDGAYDKNKVYSILDENKIKPVIPPRVNARIKKHGNKNGKVNSRDKNIRLIRKYGRRKWKRKMKYHRRSNSETNMFRYKIIIGDKLKSRIFSKQKIESKIACKIINKMTRTGMPISVKIIINAA